MEQTPEYKADTADTIENNIKQLESIFKVKQVEKEPSTLRGILQTKDYDNFIILSDIGDLLYEFKGAKLANMCLPGDHVEWINGECKLELRYEHSPIVGTIELTNKTKYGLTSRGIPMYLFTPYNKSYPHFIVGCSDKNVSHNMIALITFDKWKSTFPRGNIKTIVGVSGDYNAEKEALIWQASPYVYPKYKYNPEQKNNIKRKVLNGYTFNIDPTGCKDVDDVFTFEALPIENLCRVTITISDVASYIDDGSPIDIMASLIGQTLYDSTGEVIRPMLPSVYSEKVCSLLPGKESYGVSLQFIWDGLTISDIQWFETQFQTNKSYTYEEFQMSDSIYKKLLADIASHLAQQPLDDSHMWVEQLMIFYNKEAGKKLKESKMGILRKHSEPNMDRLERYTKQCISADIKKLAYSSAVYCLSDECETMHFGLNSNTYAHATSPIRRYVDLVNQRILKLLLNNSIYQYIVPQTMYDINLREKAIKHFTRDLDFLDGILCNNTTTKGIILEKIKLDNFVKVVLYIPLWKRTISTTYKYISDNTVLSRDELSVIDVTDFKEVDIQYSCNMNARNWKERIVISIM